MTMLTPHKYLLGLIVALVLVAAVEVAQAADPDDAPRPVPLTRPELKQLIEDVKVRKPRIPLPELTPAEREQLGEQGAGYESRLRSVYMPGINDGRGAGGGRAGQGGAQPGGNAGVAGGFQREQDPSMTLDNAFKVELFWIVSRVNNCQYCLGHQESKLLGAGLNDDRIAALDGDWAEFSPAEQTAFAFARKFTHEPQLLSDADIAGLRKHFTDLQILEMILSMAGNNSINRWKEGVGVPQRKDEGGYSRMARQNQPGQTQTGRPPASPEATAKLPSGSYLTPTSAAYEKLVTRVAPILVDKQTGAPSRATVCIRPPLESREQVEAQLAKCRQRTSRLPLVEEAQARTVLAENWTSADPLPNWVRLLANFPRSGVRQVTTIVSSDSKGDLTPLLKAQLSWIIARQDRAWYTAGLAQRRLHAAGQTDDQIYALDGDWQGFTPRERALFVVARKLAASPVVLTDAEVARAVELAGPRDVVQTVSYTTTRASFDRITEAAGLPLE